MISIFIASFVNTGIIILFTNADLRYSVLSFMGIQNQYADLNQDWYLDMGPNLFKTMLVMSVFPYVEFVMFGAIKTLLKMLDSGCYFCRSPDAPLRTKKKT